MGEAQLSDVNCAASLTPALYDTLIAWVGRRYREELRPEDLGEPKLLREVRDALDELTGQISRDADQARALLAAAQLPG